MPPESSHAETLRPSPHLALLAASIVAAHDRAWLARPVSDLARSLGVRPEWPSRAKARLLARFEDLVRGLKRRGRPPAAPEDDTARRLAATDALLAVARDVLATRGVRGRSLQDRLAAAAERLRTEHGLSRRAFTRALAIPERTFRAWAHRTRRPLQPTPPPLPLARPPRREDRRGRFDLSITPPGVQAMADTSDWRLFGVDLKVVAVQDPGQRHRRLFEAADVDDHEDAEVVVRVVTRALADRPGTQILTDQGTPYLADAARAAYESLEADHAPQKEATPTEKATLERAFGTLKSALAPLAALTERVALAVPALRDAALAKGAGRLLLSTFLAVYLAGRRAQGGSAAGGPGPDPAAFETLAEGSRERARAEHRSVKLALADIHRRYDFPGPTARFVRTFRHHHVADIRQAERAMGWRACRCYAKHCDRYFAAILRRVADEHGALRAERRAERLRALAEKELERKIEAQRAHRRDHPEDWVAASLDEVARAFRPDRPLRPFGPLGPPEGELRRAANHLHGIDPATAPDRVEVGWTRWRTRHPEAASAQIAAVRGVLDRLLAGRPPATPSTHDLARAILSLGEPAQNRRPPPSPPLRI